MALYDATNGDDWDDNTNWLSDESICEWYGVRCNSEGRVDRIGLYYNSLQGTISTELGLMKGLQELWVEGNSLQGTIPTELGLLTSLEYLYVHTNSLYGTIPTELGLLASLEVLWVHTNSLQGTIPTELGLLTSLQGLGVYRNSLEGAVPNEVCVLRDINGGSLEELYADCEEVECTCCTVCCVDGGSCTQVVG